MKGRKQPPLSSSLFADYSGVDFKPTTAAPSSSTGHHMGLGSSAITPQSSNHRGPAHALAPAHTPNPSSLDESLPLNSTYETNPIRSLHPHLSLSKISPAMDRLVSECHRMSSKIYLILCVSNHCIGYLSRFPLVSSLL